MTTYLKMEGYEANLVNTRYHMGGIDHLFKFENGYGASVVKHRYSYGGPQKLWELAVVRFDDSGEWDLNYDTEITFDVIGYQTDEEIRELLGRIKNLDEPKVDET